nr:hypothetical protein [Lamprobacter modestohalophilus]
MHFEWAGSLCDGHDAYHCQHNFGWELNEKVANFLADRDILFKIHIFPSSNNLALLKNQKKVVLLRAPEDIVMAYRRGAETGVYRSRLNAFSGCNTEREWMEAAISSGLYDSLLFFHNKWKAETDNVLHVDFEDLVRFPKLILNKIEVFWGLKVTETSQLEKHKYSRSSSNFKSPLDLLTQVEAKEKQNPLFVQGKWIIDDEKY